MPNYDGGREGKDPSDVNRPYRAKGKRTGKTGGRLTQMLGFNLPDRTIAGGPVKKPVRVKRKLGL